MGDDIRLLVIGGLVSLLGLLLLLESGTDDFTGERTAAFPGGIVLIGAGAAIALVGVIRLGRRGS